MYSCGAHHLLICVFGECGLDGSRGCEKLVPKKPILETLLVLLEQSGDTKRRIPNPAFQLGLDGDGFAPILPAIDGKVLVDLPLDTLSAEPFLTTAIEIAHHQGVREVSVEHSQEIVRFAEDTAVMPRMRIAVERK